MMSRLSSLVVASVAALASALPHASIKRQVSQLRDDYDFIIAGGGTCGLTVADRLTEAFPKKTVLVIEYGETEYAPGIFDPPATVWGGSNSLVSAFRYESLPNPDVKNKTANMFGGMSVGGSSAMNGMYFDRPSRFDFQAWTAAGSPEFDSSEDKWNWEGIYPYFKKSVTFTEPPAAVVEKHGYTWDKAAYGGTTPIYSSFPPFLWADHPIARNTWKDMGIPELKECGGGDKNGLCWIPISQHPVTARRSHAGLGHYAAVSAARPNYDLLVKHQVTRVVYPNGPKSGPPVVELRSLKDNRMFNKTAKAEVIVAAGAIQTPPLLLRSGMGSASVLKAAGIPVVIELPGVGSNLQDHSGPGLSWNYTKPGNFSPLPSDMFTPSFAADAAAQFNETPARGPYTLAMSNSAIYRSLPNMTASHADIIKKIRAMAADGSAASYLPADYRSDPAMVAGYKQQLAALANLLENPVAPSLEAPFATGTAMRAINLHPLSRGTVRLDPQDHLRDPILDYRVGSNPADFDVYVAHTRYLGRMLGTATMRLYGAVEVGPPPGAQSDEALVDYVKDQMTLSFMHPCCTAAMLPREKGGVVGPDARVHGADGLRVVDISILPFLPSAHLSATAYAVAEKAADIIIKHWSKPTTG